MKGTDAVRHISLKSKCRRDSEIVNRVISQNELNLISVVERGEFCTPWEFQPRPMSFDRKTANEIVSLLEVVSSYSPLFSSKRHPAMLDAPITNQSDFSPNGRDHRLLSSLISLHFVP